MHKVFFRAFFVIVCSLVGYLIAEVYLDPPYSLAGFPAGLILAFIVFVLERSIAVLTPSALAGSVIGLISGLIVSFLIDKGLVGLFPLFMDKARPPILAALLLCLGYLGLFLGLQKGFEAGFVPRGRSAGMDNRTGTCKILDTSVIIDGRFADICRTGFIEGVLVIPRFVLEELQKIADSADSLKRSRGRHGLEMLNRMKEEPERAIEIVDIDFPKLKGVDAKLVALAKQRNAAVVTNDYNLNKVAELQGVRVLNINDLANALKPQLLPGESMTIKILKEGKEPGQGVAYLDDGTMVVVDDGARYIKKNVDVTVTSVLQTTAGRLIFSRVRDDTDTLDAGKAFVGN